ncbi:MAG: hypothetical protein WA989_08045, partial [Henriciella sp.]
MKQIWIAPVLATVLLAAGCNNVQETSEVPPKETATDAGEAMPVTSERAELIGKGETIAQTLCATCHAVEETGE